MLTLYTVLLTIHIMLVVGWVGAGLTQQLLFAQMGPGPAYAAQLDWFGRKWFPAVSGATGLVGILLWIDGPWGAGDLWIILAVIGWIASSVIGATQLGPRADRYKAAGGTDTALWGELVRLMRIDLAILALVIIDMVIKPGL